jgi:hypothetical protein
MSRDRGANNIWVHIVRLRISAAETDCKAQLDYKNVVL